jgi:hypothetical protein
MVNKTILFVLILLTVFIFAPADFRDNPKKIRPHRYYWKDVPLVQSELKEVDTAVGGHAWQEGEYTHEDIPH